MQLRSPEKPVLQDYVYSRLPDASIRLLKFKSRGPLNTVECDLQVFPLSPEGRLPKYHTLSYCWGDPTRNSSLRCNGKEVLITTTLEEALLHLVALDRGNVEWIWIDQICIDQTNKEEKGTQVNMMREIYQKSERTTIWLGPEIKGIETTSSLLEKMWRLHIEDQDLVSGSRKRKPYTPSELEATNLPPARDRSWKVLVELLSRPWFVRTWVIQEAVLSSMHPQMLCGSYKLDWEKLLGACSWMRSMCYSITPISHNIEAWTATRSLNLFNDLKNIGGRWEMATLLMRAMGFQASEPRDKVYSLVGLSGEGSDSTYIPKALQANYDKPCRDVFRDVTRYIIKSSANLSIFALVRYIPEGKALPTWSVDFTANAQWEQISNLVMGYHHRGWHSMREKPNKASGNLPVDMPASPSDDVLALRGLSIDIVGTLCETMSRSNLNSSGSQALFAWKSAYEYTKNRRLDLARAFMVTLTANWGLTETVMMEHEPLSNFWAYLWQAHDALLKISEDHDAVKGELQHVLEPQNANDPGDADLYRLHLNAAYNRRMFFTKHKYFLGLGPKSMQQGDILCVLFGGATPFILRPDGEQFRFVGECYIYNLMSGEAIRDWEEGIYTEQSFHLI
ncbi:heterokaryon incompatibility protein [Rutstroemia sp. NJR-2017a BVV2]|nr:heterokaryon incompatibility protein [Rutstroemia sp. NJR-2017a BVV2]